jgi:L-amino acid N-acyltransferase YncA
MAEVVGSSPTSSTPRMIRHADPERDSGACATIYAPYVAGAATSFEEQAPDADDFAERIERVSLTHPWLVAERDGRVAGFSYAASHRARPAYRWTAETSVYVADGHQRNGVGRELYAALLGLLRAQGMHVALAGITQPNEASVALHRTLGYEQVGTYRRIGYKAGAWRDVSWWQLVLSEDASRDGSPPEPLGPQRLA